mgnify:CR=1 FL=1|jgi:hypothetical protein
MNRYRIALTILLIRAGMPITRIAEAFEVTPEVLDVELREAGFTRVGGEVLHSPNELKMSLAVACAAVEDIERLVDTLPVKLASAIDAPVDVTLRSLSRLSLMGVRGAAKAAGA